MPAIITHEDCINHEVPQRHPESSERIRTVLSLLDQTRLLFEYHLLSAELATEQQLQRVHDSQYLDTLRQLVPKEGLRRLDADTGIGPTTLRAASRAVGAALAAVDQCVHGDHRRTFCLVRPPGHHAESSHLMGFCYYNSVAVAADYALDFVDRVAILDFDAHHCNGTVDIFSERPEVLVCSSYQYPFYPYRHLDLERPNLVNTRLAAGTNSLTFRKAIESTWIAAIEAHKPELILVSAGFDGHVEDPLAELNLEDDDFAWITELIVDLSNRFSRGRIVSTLEGGYALDALKRSVALHLEYLLY